MTDEQLNIFMDAIKAEMGDSVTFDNQNASGDMSTVTTIVNSLVSNNAPPTRMMP